MAEVLSFSGVYRRWELKPTDNESWIDLSPAGIPFYDGGDWWCAKVEIPADGFEMNFIFTDGEGTYENNNGLDFMISTAGGPTLEQWKEVFCFVPLIAKVTP